MSTHNYWLDLFTGTTWQEFLDDGAEITGFRESRWKAVQKIRPGNTLLCYLTGISRWIAVLETTSEPYFDRTPIWKDEEFPCRIRVKAVKVLTPETAIPIHNLRDQLTIFQNLSSPNAWTGHLRGSPTKWRDSDGVAVVNAIFEGERNPIKRPVDPAKLARRPRALKATKIGLVTVPGIEVGDKQDSETDKDPTEHTEIQQLLLNLGSDLRLDVWIARNDRGRVAQYCQEHETLRLIDDLPVQFDEATTKTIELIDVLWLKKNAIVAAFEIESTTSIYSGLLRLSDLIAMQPNLKIPLYIVAPDERRDKVISEVNRPTFSRLSPPMSQMCRYISFSSLRDGISRASPMIRYLKPEFIEEEISESCEVEEI